MSLEKPKLFNIVPPPSESKINDDVLKKSYTDLIYFGRAFLPKDFLNKSASPKFHYEVASKLISTEPGARICNILPRGFGKSILSKAAILHKMCFSPQGSRLFIAWVAEEQGQSIDHLKYIKTHLEVNDKIKYYFVCKEPNGTPTVPLVTPPNKTYWVADECSKSLTGCRKRWGADKGKVKMGLGYMDWQEGELPYGGFPAAKKMSRLS